MTIERMRKRKMRVKATRNNAGFIDFYNLAVIVATSASPISSCRISFVLLSWSTVHSYASSSKLSVNGTKRAARTRIMFVTREIASRVDSSIGYT